MGGAQSPSSLIAQLVHLTASLHQVAGVARSQLIHISSGLVERGLLSLTKTLLSPLLVAQELFQEQQQQKTG